MFRGKVTPYIMMKITSFYFIFIFYILPQYNRPHAYFIFWGIIITIQMEAMTIVETLKMLMAIVVTLV